MPGSGMSAQRQLPLRCTPAASPVRCCFPTSIASTPLFAVDARSVLSAIRLDNGNLAARATATSRESAFSNVTNQDHCRIFPEKSGYLPWIPSAVLKCIYYSYNEKSGGGSWGLHVAPTARSFGTSNSAIKNAFGRRLRGACPTRYRASDSLRFRRCMSAVARSRH